MKEIAVNRQARFEYFVEDSFEAGIVLEGSEVKSIRRGGVNLRDSFALIENGEVWLKNAHISPYEKSSAFNTHDAKRDRKLLLQRKELEKLGRSLQDKGLTVVGLKLFINERGLAKLQIGLAKGRKSYDKREYIKEKDARREMDRVFRK